MIQNTSISFLGEDSASDSRKASNAAPLEQNVKNLECDGTIYKVVKEDPGVLRQRYAISPSRKAIVRQM